ncbi:toxin-antitoxin system YwqK family antitoxin [uncultured Winogradskyella sp.]|uniref:toxin-antitoxin system YwqK family antitoxin n=1 Tax=uncultured Winogradskyella sp. TaxID=395353 RepID=UPI002618254B|nr:toxin-antitoxin system YwqK family antitoxin [uncultured Winogradskyella sp.]
MIKQKVFLCLFFTITLTTIYAQKSVNQFDKAGKRHGLWTKNYHQTDQKRYEGTFVHGKEVDSFKFYTLSKGKSVLSAIKVFNEKDSIADITFYASNKKIISKGKMDGKRFVGQWIYYHKDSTKKMIVENFNDEGTLEGERYVYYDNGLVAEQASYKNGQLNGEAKWFLENEVLIKSSQYKNDKLEGKTINYDASGKKDSEGNYIANQKKGVWKYYKDGKIAKEIDHTNNKVIKKYE